LRCSKGRKYVLQQKADLPDSRRRRKTSSHMTSCSYMLRLSRLYAGGPWAIFRNEADSANEYNYELLAPSVYLRVRRIAVEKRKAAIISSYKSGVRPIQILTQIQHKVYSFYTCCL
ncbi:hypothetical protein M431DRAFT_77255, partial [Trichoderma harzianum CBS 226.95]